MNDFKLQKVSLERLKKENKLYPITFNFENYQAITSLKLNKKDYKSINDYKTPPGIKVYRLLSEKKYQKLIEVVNTIIEDNFASTKRTDTVYTIRHCPEEKRNIKNKNTQIKCLNNQTGITNFFSEIKISRTNKTFLKNVFIKICELYSKKDTCDYLLENSSYALFKYKGSHRGLKLHVDNIMEFQGPVFIFNLGKSIIDFVPFSEIYEKEKKYKPIRLILDPGVVYAADGDARFDYVHGIPFDMSDEKTIRYAIVVRFPVYYKNTKMCKLNEVLKRNFDREDFENRKIKFKNRTKDFTVNGLFPCYSDTYHLE